jgi:hypothetical protein
MKTPIKKLPSFIQKIYLADHKDGISGSANLTYSGLNTNIESLNIAETRKELLQMENDFLRIWLKYEKEGMSKEALSAKTSYSIRNALPIPNDFGFLDQPHIEKKKLVYYPYYFFEYRFRGSVNSENSSTVDFDESGFLLVDGINSKIINNDHQLIEEINNNPATNYILSPENKYIIDIRQAKILDLREAQKLTLDYLIKNNHYAYYGVNGNDMLYVPRRNEYSFIKEYSVQVPFWYLTMYLPDGKHQKIVMASSRNLRNDLLYCPICQTKINIKDSVSCTACKTILCSKCKHETEEFILSKLKML